MEHILKANKMVDVSENEEVYLCERCGARCCRHVALEIDKPKSKRDYDIIRWYLMHKDVTVSISHKSEWILEFQAQCLRLTEKGRCAKYEERPRICRDYPAHDEYCEGETTEPTYRMRFEKAEEFERYLNKKGIDWRWKRG